MKYIDGHDLQLFLLQRPLFSRRLSLKLYALVCQFLSCRLKLKKVEKLKTVKLFVNFIFKLCPSFFHHLYYFFTCWPLLVYPPPPRSGVAPGPKLYSYFMTLGCHVKVCEHGLHGATGPPLKLRIASQVQLCIHPSCFFA